MATHDYRITDYSYIHSHKEEDFEAFLNTINPKDGDKILEVFCGYGETTQKLIVREKSQGISCEHYLCDASITQIDRAIQALKDEPSIVSIMQADARELPCGDEMFDIVVVKMGLHEINKESQTVAMQEIFRILKKGGKFVTWEIALLDDLDQQRIFREVIYRKNELAGFHEINQNRYFQTEDGLLNLFEATGFSSYEKVHDIWYLFESIRRKEEMVSVEKKLILDSKGMLDEADEKSLNDLATHRLEEFNKSILEIIPEDVREKVKFQVLAPDNLAFLAHKEIVLGIK